MEQRIVDFITGLRAAGVRISVAESADCFQAVEQIGVMDRDRFRAALQATLIKDQTDLLSFDQLFAAYFGSGGPPLVNPQEGLTPEQQAALEEALRALSNQLAQMMRQLMSGQELSQEQLDQLRRLLDAMQPVDADQSPQQRARRNAALRALARQLAQLLSWLLSGQGPSQEEMQQLGQSVGLPQGRHAFQQPWFTRRMLRAMGWELAKEVLEQLMGQLAAAGMDQEALERLREMIAANQEALAEQVGQFVGASIARQMAEQPPPISGPDLMHRPFRALSEREAEELRDQIRRLAARLRSRAALRQRRAKEGVLDAKATIRASLRYDAVPIVLRHKRRQLKPKLALICDVSTSMRHCAEFMLRLIYELQDQVARARSFAFIDDLHEISQDFAEHRPEVAVQTVLTRLQPGYYNTNLGHSLATFCRDHFDSVDHRTTVIILGDGRNNYSDPRLDLMQGIQRRARRVIWLNPESPRLWGTGDSDMPLYVPYCDAVHEVANLAQLAEAVDRLLSAS